MKIRYAGIRKDEVAGYRTDEKTVEARGPTRTETPGESAFHSSTVEGVREMLTIAGYHHDATGLMPAWHPAITEIWKDR